MVLGNSEIGGNGKIIFLFRDNKLKLFQVG